MSQVADLKSEAVIKLSDTTSSIVDDVPQNITVEQAIINLKSKFRALSKNDLIRNMTRFYIDNMSLRGAVSELQKQNADLKNKLTKVDEQPEKSDA